MSSLDEEWKIAPHNCVPEEYKEISPPCSSFVVERVAGGSVLYESMDEELARHIVSLHNASLKPPSLQNFPIQAKGAYILQTNYIEIETRVLANLAAQGITGIEKLGNSLSFESIYAYEAFQEEFKKEKLNG